MKITIPKRDLVRATSRGCRIAQAKSSLAMLSNVELAADVSGRLTIAATDLSESVRVSVPCECSQAGSVAVNAKSLADMAKSLPEGPVTLTVGKNFALEIKAGKVKFKLPGMSSEDFPTLPVAPESGGVAMPADTLTALIAGVYPAMSTDQTRAHLCCMLFASEDGKQRVVTTDGHRLLTRYVECDQTISATIPARGIAEVRDLCATSAGADVQVSQSGGVIFFSVGGVELGVKLADDQFPPWKKVVPSKWTRTVTVLRTAFADAVKRISLVGSDKSGGIRLTCSADAVQVESENPDKGEGAESVDATSTAVEVLVIGVNAQYLAEALAVLSHDEVQLCLSGELDPIVVRGADDGSHLATVMPMRI